MEATADAEMPRGDIKADKPKLLLYIDRNVEATISLKKRGKRTFGKKHTEVVSCYQTQDGTEGTKENDPAIVINRQSIDWSITRSGKTLETFSQWYETFKVDQKAKFGSFGRKSDSLDSDYKEQGSEEDLEYPIEKTQVAHEKQETFEVNQEAKSSSEDPKKATLHSEYKEQDYKEDLDHPIEKTQDVHVNAKQESHLTRPHFTTDHRNEIRVSHNEWITRDMHQALIEVDMERNGDGDQNRALNSKPSWFGLKSAGGASADGKEVVLIETERKSTKAADGHHLTSSKGLQESSASDESGSSTITKEVLNATRSQITVEKKIID